MARLFFWMSLLMLLYAFVGYPVLLRILAAIRGRASRAPDPFFPKVSIVLSVFNEEKVIRGKIENFLALNYPDDALELVIICDKCTDRTEDIIINSSCERIKLLVQEKRSGKTLNLNRGVAAATGEIIVFTDANSMFLPDAVKLLVGHFSQAEIGLVSGRSVYIDTSDQTEEVAGLYRRYEEMIKEAESSACSIVGADGAIYAFRKSLFQPLAAEHINDFVHPIQAVLQGCRAISDRKAACHEVVDESYGEEFGRQTRIMAQSWLIIFSHLGRLLLSGRFLYSWQLVSHKLLRWLTIPLMSILLIASLFMLESGGSFYIAAFCLQLLFLLMSAFGKNRHSGFFRVAYMFMLLHLAAMLGLIRYMSGHTYQTWNPRNN